MSTRSQLTEMLLEYKKKVIWIDLSTHSTDLAVKLKAISNDTSVVLVAPLEHPLLEYFRYFTVSEYLLYYTGKWIPICTHSPKLILDRILNDEDCCICWQQPKQGQHSLNLLLAVLNVESLFVVIAFIVFQVGVVHNAEPISVI